MGLSTVQSIPSIWGPIGGSLLHYLYNLPENTPMKIPQKLPNRPPGTKTLTKRKKQGTLRRSMKKAVLAETPAKHFTAESSVVIAHNSVYTMVPTQGIVQGTGNTNRLADKIWLAALKVTGTFVSNRTAGAYKYRIIVGWTGEELTAGSISITWSSSGLSTSQLFLPSTATLFANNGLINSKAVTVLHDQMFDLNSVISGISDIQSFAFSVPLNTNFLYQESGSIQGKTRNLFMCVLPVVPGQLVAPGDAGTIVCSYDLIFK